MLSAASFADAVELVDSIIAPGPLGYCIIDHSFRYVKVNDRLAKLNGRPPEEHIGRHLREILGDSMWERVEPIVERTLAGETISDLIYDGPALDNPDLQLYVSCTFVPIRVDGEVIGVALLTRDLTARTRAEQALQRSELQFQQLVETAEEGIWIVDREHRITFVNPQMAAMLGYSVDEMLGSSMYDYLDEEAKRVAERYMRRRQPNGRDKREFCFRRQDGSHAWMLIATTGMPSDESEHSATVGLFTDITHRKEAEIERERLLQQERAARTEAERARRQIAMTLESINDGFVSFDCDWKYTYVNRQAARMLERGSSELLGKGVWHVSPEAIDRPFHHACIRAVREQIPVEIEELQDCSGRWFAYQIFPSSEGVSVFFFEITDRKHMALEKQELQRQKDRVEDQQRAFLRDMLWAVTDKRLVMCWSPNDLPAKLPHCAWDIGVMTQYELPEMRERIREEATRLGYERCRIQDLIIAASEAAMNSIVHGGGGTAWVGSQEGGPIQVWLCDKGAGISIEHMPRAVLERGFTTAGSMGHGMKIMLQTIDRAWLLTGPQGTTVVLEQKMTPNNLWF